MQIEDRFEQLCEVQKSPVHPTIKKNNKLKKAPGKCVFPKEVVLIINCYFFFFFFVIYLSVWFLLKPKFKSIF